MKINYEELLGYYKAIRYGNPNDGEYEDAIEALLNAMPELIAENQTLQECVQKLEQQKNWLAKKCEDLSDDVKNFFMPYHIPAKVWIERAEKATKE